MLLHILFGQLNFLMRVTVAGECRHHIGCDR
ncbi:Uncharacterised protein [Vibrio cholerae]|nr:Uncharacterised protein [Vibrio cholerae]